MAIETAIYTRLTGFTALTDLLATATSVWMILAPQNAARPFLTYKIFDEDPGSDMGGDTAPTEAQLRVNIFTDTAEELITLGAQVLAALQRYSGTVGGEDIQQIFYQGRNDMDGANNEFHRILDFQVFF